VERHSAQAVFLDFYKAYDTVDRNFPLDCLAGLGVGPGFLRWMERLHTGTGVTALVNGHRYPRVPTTSDILQGWPLAPLLYLAVGQALLTWLKSGGIGLPAGDRHVTASQYTDDCTSSLDSPGALHPFLAAMDVFRLASSRRLNIDKVKLLPLGGAAAAAVRSGGPPAAPPPQHVSGPGTLAAARRRPPPPTPTPGPVAASLLSSLQAAAARPKVEAGQLCQR
jgi:hypothetical protein